MMTPKRLKEIESAWIDDIDTELVAELIAEVRRLQAEVLTFRGVDAARTGRSVCILCTEEVADLAVHVCGR
jgi:hypothetical protein